MRPNQGNLDAIIKEQKERAALSNRLITGEAANVAAYFNAGPKRVRSIRPYYFASVLNSINQAVSTNLYYYTDLRNDNLAALSNATLGNLPTQFAYYGNLYFMVYPPSAQTAAFQCELGVTTYQKDSATIRSVQWQRLDAFDDNYNTYPTHTGTLFAAVNAWTKPNQVYERNPLLFHCAGIRVNTNATGTVAFNWMIKFSGYQVETTEA